jgi:hypothetical protein
MSPRVSTNPPTYEISQTEKGWLLVIQNEHCSVMQVFRTADIARDAVGRMMEFFETMRTQAPAARQAA